MQADACHYSLSHATVQLLTVSEISPLFTHLIVITALRYVGQFSQGFAKLNLE
jgi:hypothetical protein